MRSLGRGSLCCLLLSLVLPVGCSCNTVLPPSSDSGPHDAPRRGDAAEAGSMDDADIDTGPEIDSDVDSGGPDVGSCVFVMSEDLVELATDPRSHTSTIGLAGGLDRFGVAYSAVGLDAFENVYFAEIPSSGSTIVAAAQLTRDLATTTAPVVSHVVGGGWLLSWVSNRAATYDIYGYGIDAMGHTVGAQQVTMDGLTQGSPILGTSGATTLVAWDELDATATIHTTVLHPIGADGMPTGAAARLAVTGFSPSPQALASTDDGFVLGWSDPDGDAVIMPLSAAGAPMGVPASLTTAHDSDRTIDLAMSFGGGAAVYGARIEGFVGFDSGMSGVDAGGEVIGGRFEVHAHLIDGAGLPYDVEHSLTAGADSGTDASIAEFAGGYAIAYRQTGTTPMLRVLFVDSLLHEVARLDLVPISLLGGRTTIRASGDGSLLVAWADVVGSETQIRAARIRCN